MRFLFFVTILFLGGGLVAEAKKGSNQAKAETAMVVSLAQQAKAALSQGNRKLALELLDRAKQATKSKAELKDIASRKILFAEQFITSESFQNYQEAKGFADLKRWDDCLRELDTVSEKDRDNLLVMRLRADCQYSLKQYEAASKTLQAIFAAWPGDVEATIKSVEIDLAQKRATQGIATLDALEPVSSQDLERLVILKGKLLEQLDRGEEAAEILRDDQEAHLDHVGVLYELGMLYARLEGHDWPARKTLSLFVTRCKRMKDSELKAKGFDVLLPQAQATLAGIDRKLGV